MPQQPQAVDYDALAKQHGGTAAAAGGVDYDALAAQHGGSSAGQTDDTWGGALHQFWDRVNPVTWAHGVVAAAKNPASLVYADPDFLKQAHDAYQKGDYSVAGQKVLAFLSMGMGHDLDAQAELWRQGKYKEATGAGLGMVTQFAAPEAAMRGVGAASDAAKMTPANPAVAEAVRFGQQQGVPIDAATATDNAAIRGVQHIADRTLGGANVAAKAAQAQQTGLATVGEQLAAKGYRAPVTPESAGAGVNDALAAAIEKHDAIADAAYGRLRDIAAQNVQTVERTAPVPAPPETAAFTFQAKPNALVDPVFEAAYADAKKSGYTGTKADLRARFDQQLQSGFSAIKDRDAAAAEYGPAALLKSIRQLGGLRPTDPVYGGELKSLSDSATAYTGLQQRAAATIFRKDGLALDDMVDQLHQDPRWSKIEDGNALIDMLDEIGRAGRQAKPGRATVEDALRLTDVRPGAQWWIDRTTEDQALPVDLRPAQQQLGPLYQQLLRERELNGLMMGDKGRALLALDKIMNAGDSAPLETVDRALSDLKAMARGNGDLAVLRSEGQGAAASAVRSLDAQVQLAAAKAGPEAIQALREGRQATATKYAIAKVYDAVRDEPVQAFNQAIAPQDTAIEHLRSIAQYAPEELPKIGRAYLDSLLDKATAQGGFTGADGLWANWQRMGPETKAMLFQDPAYIKNLDNFFLLAKQTAKNANPSGTAHAAAIAAQGGAFLDSIVRMDPRMLSAAVGSVAGSAGVSAFLHSAAGTRILTQGLLPLSSAGRAAWLAKVRQFAAAQGLAVASQPSAATGGGSQP